MLCQKTELNKAPKKKRKPNKCPTGFKKAPQAPRRFKSISKIQEYKRIHKNAKVTSFSSLISKEWKTMSQEEKNKWKIAAERDKLRYNAEKLMYKGPWQVPTDRLPKDPTAPKRPPSAFLNYCRTRRTELIEANPHVKNTDISKLLGIEWRTIPQELRQPHIDQEKRDREIYHQKVSDWRKRQELKKEVGETADREIYNQEVFELQKQQELEKGIVNATERIINRPFMEYKEGGEVTYPFQRSKSLPTAINSIEVPLSLASVTQSKLGRRDFQSASFSVQDRTPKTLMLPFGESTRNQVWSSLGRANSENVNVTRRCPSMTSRGLQNFQFPTFASNPSLMTPETQPDTPSLDSLGQTFANFPALRSSNVLSINTELPVSYSMEEPTPVTPSSSSPIRNISCSEYQEPLADEEVDYLLHASIED